MKRETPMEYLRRVYTSVVTDWPMGECRENTCLECSLVPFDLCDSWTWFEWERLEQSGEAENFTLNETELRMFMLFCFAARGF